MVAQTHHHTAESGLPPHTQDPHSLPAPPPPAPKAALGSPETLSTVLQRKQARGAYLPPPMPLLLSELVLAWRAVVTQGSGGWAGKFPFPACSPRTATCEVGDTWYGVNCKGWTGQRGDPKGDGGQGRNPERQGRKP